ncbi:PAS and ANTAR domain-containing protein [Promicromonospora thailandica]|uniref:PAS fold-containing protein n=1 Tax=Promicromonospora thailandica TaxID=765201 RepID=A0A9X2JW88_9MICO|nr:PAS and ANTAR domain-containing protein [Promicromonospora thailandica]MCP2265292.1 PAS fold-containing protein [Promicromonospora thailandica]
MTEPMEIERALTLGTNHVVGRYRYDIARQVWWWSDETYRIHGFEPGDIVPTTSLVLAHKHPGDRARVSRVLAHAALTGDPFSSVHRIMDARGRERTLTVVGEGRRDPATQRVSELVGFFVDITAGIEVQASEAATASIRAAAASRAVIEQAKGVLAFVLDVDPDAAFARLRATSNDTNVAVRELAQRVVATACTAGSTAADVIALVSSGRDRAQDLSASA